MKIWVISLLILLAFLIFGCWAQDYFNNTSKKLSFESDQIESLIKQRNWSAAQVKLKSIKVKWSGYKKILSMLIHHQEIDRLEEALTKTIQAVNSQSYSDSLVEIGTLKHFLKHVAEKENLNFINVL